MNLFISLEIASEVRHLSDAVMRLEERINSCLKPRNYGSDLETIFVGLIIVDDASSKFHPKRELEYKKRLRFNDITTGKKIEMANVISFDINVNYDVALRSNHEDAEKYLALLLLENARSLESHHHLFPDFDLSAFLLDLQACSLEAKIG